MNPFQLALKKFSRRATSRRPGTTRRDTMAVSSNPGIDIKHLKTVSALAEQGSLAGAALTLNLTQSALSHQLKELETRLNLELYLRKSRTAGADRGTATSCWGWPARCCRRWHRPRNSCRPCTAATPVAFTWRSIATAASSGCCRCCPIFAASGQGWIWRWNRCRALMPSAPCSAASSTCCSPRTCRRAAISTSSRCSPSSWCW